MALNIDLQKIVTSKPAGDYFLYYDRSIVPELVSASGLRILVGQSKQGVVNTLTYHDKWESFKQIYGDVDRSIERNGSYFHRSAYVMLSSGQPIAALNLRAFDDTKDKSGQIAFSTQSDKNNATVKEVAYTSLFDKERFWKVSPNNVVDNANVDNLLSFANVGSNKVTIFVRKALETVVDGTIENYYTNVLGKTVPDNLYKQDKVSDTFVDVFVFNNDFSDLASNQSNPSYGHLFNARGVVKATTGTLSESTDGLGQLSQIKASGFVKKYTGSLVADMVDASNKSLFVVNEINADFATVGLVAGINNTMVDNVARWTPTLDASDNVVLASNGGKKDLAIDLVGHKLWKTNASSIIDEASYNGQVVNSISYDGLVTTKLGTVDYNDILATDITLPSDETAIKIDNPWLVGKHGGTTGSFTYDVANTSQAYLLGLYPIKVGDKYVSNDSNLATITKLEYKGTKKVLIGLHTALIPLQGTGTGFTSGDVFPQDAQGKFIYPVGHAQAGQLVEFETVAPFRPLSAPLANSGTAIPKPTQNSAQVTATIASHGTAKNVYLAHFDKPLAMQSTTQITNATALATQKVTLDDSSTLDIYTSGTAKIYFQRKFEDVIDAFKPFALKKYKPRVEQFVNNTSARQAEVLTVMSSTLSNALKDRERLDFRYLVDGFKSYIDNNLKEHFTSVVKDRNVGAAILNAPSVDEFKNSTNPYFKPTTNGQFDASYVYSGGNLELPYTQTFSLASKGSNHGYFYAPWFIFDDNGSEIKFPPAPLVSNNFINKGNSGRPYDAVFGIDTGVVSGNGVKSLEYDFTDADRLSLEKSGINPIMFRKSGGNIIMGNRTAMRTNSALKFAHVNELITQIHEQMKPIALFLIGKYNNDQNRLVAKTRMDNVMRSILAQGAVQYYENIVNTKNNTQDIISEGLAVMDTVIVPGYVNEKVVHRLIVNRTTEEVTSTIL